MDEGKKGFIMFLSFADIIQELTDEEAGRLLKAIMQHEGGEEVDLGNDRLLKVAYTAITADIDRQDEKWEKTRYARSEAGKLGGAPKGNKNASKNNQEQTETNKNKQNKQEQTETNKNKQKQTETNKNKQNKQEQTETNKNKQKQTETNKNKQNKHEVEVEVEVEVEDEVEKKKKSGQAAPVRHHFGTNGKVLLTDDDLEKLYEAHGQEDTMEAIEIMDGYLTANGRSYKNYRQALENWAYIAVEENKQKGIQAKKYNNGEFPQTDLSEQLQAVEEAMLERQGAKRA